MKIFNKIRSTMVLGQRLRRLHQPAVNIYLQAPTPDPRRQYLVLFNRNRLEAFPVPVTFWSPTSVDD